MSDHLDAFLKFADAVQATHERAQRPAYTETCMCGGSVEVGRDVSRADLRRIHANFLGRHRGCSEPISDLAPVLGQVASARLTPPAEPGADRGSES